MTSETSTDYISAYEPHFRRIRYAATLTDQEPQENGYVVDFPTSVPVLNRAGKPTGRAFQTSIEPGSIQRDPLVRVQVRGRFVDGCGGVSSVEGFFYVGCVADLPPAQYQWSGDDGIAKIAADHLPQSAWFALVTREELGLEIRQARVTAESSTVRLCNVLEPMMMSKAYRAAQLVAGGSLDVEDVCQEMRVEMLRGIHLFASPRRPDTSLYSWMDRNLWKVGERQVASALGLTPTAWGARRRLADATGVEATTTLSQGSMFAARSTLQPMLDFSSIELADPNPYLSVDHTSALDAFRQAASECNLTPRQRRIFETRHREFDHDKPLPWVDVADLLGYSVSTCKKKYAEGREKLATLPPF